MGNHYLVANRKNLSQCLSQLNIGSELAVDTETTGLNPRTDKIFAIAFYNMQVCVVADFRDGDLSLDDFSFLLNKEKTWIGHNIKFDAEMLLGAGYELKGSLYCTQVHARIEYNDHLKYDLASCAERAGLEAKGDVKSYMDANNLYKTISYPGKKKKEKVYFFDQVPAEHILPYAARDVELTWKLWDFQRQKFHNLVKLSNNKFNELLDREREVTKILVEMETYGIRLDRDYAYEALRFSNKRVKEATEEFTQITGSEFKDSEKVLVPVFDRFGIPYGRTEKGSPSFTDDVLAKSDHDIAKCIRRFREHTKLSTAFFSSFLHFSKSDGRVHPFFRQSGTATGRFSCSEPNLQQLKNEDEDEGAYPVRRCFVPDPDYVLVSCDYSQMEYRLMLDYAGQMDLIEEVAKGKDIHLATAELVGISRRAAKTLNFALLFGSGAAKIADMLNISADSAVQLKVKYFLALPNVQSFIKAVIKKAKTTGSIHNIEGRVYRFHDKNFAYKAPNYLIQGGCSDIMRKALVGVHELFKGTKSRLQLSIHDEIVCSIHESELHLAERVREIMINAYKHRLLRMDANLYYSRQSLHDLKEWKSGKKEGDIVFTSS